MSLLSKRNAIRMLAILIIAVLLTIAGFTLNAIRNNKDAPPHKTPLTPPAPCDYNFMISAFILLSEHNEAFEEIAQPLSEYIFLAFEHVKCEEPKKLYDVCDKILKHLGTDAESLEYDCGNFIEVLFKRIVDDIAKEAEQDIAKKNNLFMYFFCLLTKNDESHYEYIPIVKTTGPQDFIDKITAKNQSIENIFNLNGNIKVDIIPSYIVFTIPKASILSYQEKKTSNYFYEEISGINRSKQRSHTFEMLTVGLSCHENFDPKVKSCFTSYLKGNARQSFINESPTNYSTDEEHLFPSVIIVRNQQKTE